MRACGGLGLTVLLAPMMCAKSMPSAEVASVPFTQEMRQKAMSLHTFSQAPREGKQKDAVSLCMSWCWSVVSVVFFLLKISCVGYLVEMFLCGAWLRYFEHEVECS